MSTASPWQQGPVPGDPQNRESMSVGLGLATLSPIHEAQEPLSRVQAGGDDGSWWGERGPSQAVGSIASIFQVQPCSPGTQEAGASMLTRLFTWNPLPET